MTVGRGGMYRFMCIWDSYFPICRSVFDIFGAVTGMFAKITIVTLGKG